MASNICFSLFYDLNLIQPMCLIISSITPTMARLDATKEYASRLNDAPAVQLYDAEVSDGWYSIRVELDRQLSIVSVHAYM